MSLYLELDGVVVGGKRLLVVEELEEALMGRQKELARLGMGLDLSERKSDALRGRYSELEDFRQWLMGLNEEGDENV